jgi:hypothetical protein
LFGASDGFDLSHPSWDLQLPMFAMFSRMYIKSVKEKSGRGRQGAARRFTCVGKPGLGFTRYKLRDASGNYIVDRDGKHLHGITHYEPHVEIRREICERAGLKNESAEIITRWLNETKATGRDSWTAKGVHDILKSPASIGVFVFNRYHEEHEEVRQDDGSFKEVVKRVENPHSEWIVIYDPSLAIISMDLWRTLRRKHTDRHPGKSERRRKSRNQNRATTLTSGTCVCDDCSHELTLSHSDGKYKSFYCPNGACRRFNCTLTTRKSTRVIEDRILTYLLNHIMTDEAVASLVSKTNGYLANLIASPPAGSDKLKTEIRSIKQKIERLVRDNEDEPDEATRAGFRKRIRELHQELASKTNELRKLQPADLTSVKLLDEAQMKAYLAEARLLLNQDIPVAAETLHALTGEIRIKQGEPDGRRGAPWIAMFTPQLINLLRFISKRADSPDCCTLDLLCNAIWITNEPYELTIGSVPKYEQLAPAVLANHRADVPVAASCRQFGFRCPADYYKSLNFAHTGQRPASRPRPPRQRGGSKRVPKYLQIMPDVLRMRDELKLPFAEIARQLGVEVRTVFRAYDEGHPELANRHGPDARIIRDSRRQRLTADEIAQAEICSVPDGKRPRLQITLDVPDGP